MLTVYTETQIFNGCQNSSWPRLMHSLNFTIGLAGITKKKEKKFKYLWKKTNTNLDTNPKDSGFFRNGAFFERSQSGESTNDASSSAKGKLSWLPDAAISPLSINRLPIDNWAGLNAGPRSRAKPRLNSKRPSGRGLVGGG
jgi:hypothetical protein